MAESQYTDYPGAFDHLISQILASFSQPNVTQLSLVLTVLATRTGTLLLTGRPTRFVKLSRTAREDVIRKWSTSPISDLRKVAKTFTTLPLYSLYTHIESTAHAIGYPFAGDPALAHDSARVQKAHQVHKYDGGVVFLSIVAVPLPTP